jgi:hypothetical protein
MEMKNLFIIVSLASVLLLSSTNPVKKKLIGVWKIQTMEVGGVKMMHEQLGLPFMEFNEEGGFLIRFSAHNDKGRYTVKGNDIHLKFLYPVKPAQILTITKLDNTELDYTTSDSTGLVKVACFRITQGLNGEKD